MENTLTLHIENSVITKAEEYANQHKITLSALVEKYLKSLSETMTADDIEISAFVKSISEGETNSPINTHWKEDYIDYLEKKY